MLVYLQVRQHPWRIWRGDVSGWNPAADWLQENGKESWIRGESGQSISEGAFWWADCGTKARGKKIGVSQKDKELWIVKLRVEKVWIVYPLETERWSGPTDLQTGRLIAYLRCPCV